MSYDCPTASANCTAIVDITARYAVQFKEFGNRNWKYSVAATWGRVQSKFDCSQKEADHRSQQSLIPYQLFV